MKQTVKLAVAIGGSVVTIPYAIAFLANLLLGWPLEEKKYSRAFHPKKVLSLNYALIQQLSHVRYARLYLRWKLFYRYASEAVMRKGIPYGSGEKHLDVHIPQTPGRNTLRPVVVFLYGGAWGSGNKNMYPLLCLEIANKLDAIVCCPNYSTYPKGYIDDMVQDVVDSLTWIHTHIESFGGDKERIMLVGHSAGAHLGTMAMLELAMKRLLHHPGSLTMPEVTFSTRQGSVLESIRFDEHYFDGSNGEDEENGDVLGESKGASSVQSFYMVESEEQKAAKSLSTSTYELVEEGEAGMSMGETEAEEAFSEAQPEADVMEKDSVEKSEKEGDDAVLVEAEPKEVLVLEDKETDPLVPEIVPQSEELMEKQDFEQEEAVKEHGKPPKKTTFDQYLKVVETSPEPSDLYPGEEENEEDTLSRSQKEVKDILSSIKAIVGLAGVYHIGDHYKHEYWRGIEDLSAMARAMYGPEYFDRVSPTHIVHHLPRRTRLPPIQLVHGEADTTVPVSSSELFGQAVYELGSTVSVTLIPECSHTDVCFDLMDATRSFYDPVMGILLNTAQKYL